MFLVAGADKAGTLAHVLEPTADAKELPAQRVKPTKGHLTWFVDQAAASKLSNPII